MYNLRTEKGVNVLLKTHVRHAGRGSGYLPRRKEKRQVFSIGASPAAMKT